MDVGTDRAEVQARCLHSWVACACKGKARWTFLFVRNLAADRKDADFMHDKLTQSDINKMQEEIDHRKQVERPQILKEIQEARAQGDLSENFEYYAARKANRENNSRIRYLENMIKTAIIIEDHMKDDQVGLNKRVTIRFDGEEDTETYKIVTSVRADSVGGKITPEAPLGKALMGHRVGDVCHVKVSDTIEYNVVIVALENPGEEESDTIRRF